MMTTFSLSLKLGAVPGVLYLEDSIAARVEHPLDPRELKFILIPAVLESARPIRNAQSQVPLRSAESEFVF